MDLSYVYIKMCDCKEVRKYTPVTKCDGAIWVSADEITVDIGSDRTIWLPRQDRIQEMLLDEYDEFYQLHCTFCNWALGMAENFPSGEQLWLAFYMQEKHKKKWDGKKWNKEGG